MQIDSLLLRFNFYGVLVGIAIVTAYFLILLKAKQHQLAEKRVEQLAVVGIISGLLGARLWHVATDFQLYTENWAEILQIWHGGLSIIGAIFGGLLGVWWFSHSKYGEHKVLLHFLDLVPFGLPFAQAIGRLGNYVNQELYGQPTDLPWRLYIPPEFRVSGFEQFEYFHPLFAYEAIVMLGFGSALWWWDRKKKLRVGAGQIFLLYLLCYSSIRFLLDFLRIDTAYKIGGILGINQVVLLVVFVCAFTLLKKLKTNKA